ncbi:MAG: polyprenyl synthetase family protein, partial [Schwartzia sp. (in: firmicutes)]
YGHAIGMAFQITDDLLDITGDEAKIGKPAGNDIRQGVVTLPVIRALEVSPRREELAAILRDREMSEAMVARALSIVRSSDGVDFAQRRANEQIQKAKEALPEDIPAVVREAFMQAADYISRRDF